MRTIIITLAILSALVVGSIFTGFPSPTQKRMTALKNIQKAELSLNLAQNDVNQIRKKSTDAESLIAQILEAEQTIKDNEIRIADMDTKMSKSGLGLDAFYGAKIELLQMINQKLEESILANEKKQSNWEKVKHELNADILVVRSAFKEFIIDNRK